MHHITSKNQSSISGEAADLNRPRFVGRPVDRAHAASPREAVNSARDLPCRHPREGSASAEGTLSIAYLSGHVHGSGLRRAERTPLALQNARSLLVSGKGGRV